MLEKKIALTWNKAWKNLDNAYNMSCKPDTKRVPKGYVFDADKSVRWNAEQVEKHNEAIFKDVADKQHERSAAINKATEDLVSLIIEYFDGKINEQQAHIIWNLAYDNGHSGGAYEINAHLQELLPVFSDFMEKGDNK